LEDGVEIAIPALPEFTKVNMAPGSTHRYQVVTMSNDSGELARSNEVTLVTPGQTGILVLQGAADSGMSVFLQWSNNGGPAYGVFRDGVLVARFYNGYGYSDFPLEPNHSYCYQVAQMTPGGVVLAWSNEITVTTLPADPPPPQPDPFPTRVVISLGQTLWAYATSSDQTGNYLTASVFDQYGNLMPDVRVLFMTSDPHVFSVGCDNGWCGTNYLGTAQVWAQVYDWSGIQSERLDITVVDRLPDAPIEPDVFPESDLQLASEIQFLANEPYMEYQLGGYYSVRLHNPTDHSITFYRIQLYHFDLNGQMVGDSSSSGGAKVLAPGETKEFFENIGQFQTAGNYYVQVMINLDNTAAGQRYVINSAIDGYPVKKYYRSWSLDELQGDLKVMGLNLSQGEVKVGQDVAVSVSFMNRADVAITDSFTVTVGIRGQSSETCEIDGLVLGHVESCAFLFPPLPSGTYVLDLILDSGGTVAENDESNNTASRIFEVTKDLLPPVITVGPETQTVFAGNQVTFSVTASRANPPDDSADDPLTYQWRKNETNIEGANDAIYEIPSVDSDHAGSYDCVVATAQGMTAISNCAELTVWYGLPDLIISAWAPTQAEFAQGEIPQLTGTITNQGTAPSNECRFIITDTDSPMTMVVIPVLNPQDECSFLITGDTGLPGGTYQIPGTIDPDNFVTESNEDNNTASCSLVSTAPPLVIHFSCQSAPAEEKFAGLGKLTSTP
jgi:hypothetical protein